MWLRMLGCRHSPPHLRHVQRQQLKRDQLRGEGLGRCDADFRSGVRVDRSVRFSRRHAADDVADRDAPSALALGLAERGERVGGLA